MKSNIVDIEVTLHHETKVGNVDEGALLISLDGNNDSAVWVPKSQIEFEQETGRSYSVSLPYWLAYDKGLI